jgi:tetratricopeptide (TPR) repeat protein
VMACWGLADLAAARRVSEAWLTSISAVVLLILAGVTRHQLAYWSDEVSLWTHTIQTTSDNFVAEDNLGTTLLDRHDMDQAIVHFRRSAAIEPHDGLSELNIGVYEERSHHWPEAIAAYKQGISETEEADIRARGYSNLGYVYVYSGDDASARGAFEQALQLAPDTEQAWIGLGVLAQRSGDLTAAMQQYSHANQIRPSGLGYLLLARVLHKSGRDQEAEAMLQTARSAAGNFPATQHTADELVGR